MKSKISTGALFAMLLLMAMLPRTGHSQEIDPNAYYDGLFILKECVYENKFCK